MTRDKVIKFYDFLKEGFLVVICADALSLRNKRKKMTTKKPHTLDRPFQMNQNEKIRSAFAERASLNYELDDVYPFAGLPSAMVNACGEYRVTSVVLDRSGWDQAVRSLLSL